MATPVFTTEEQAAIRKLYQLEPGSDVAPIVDFLGESIIRSKIATSPMPSVVSLVKTRDAEALSKTLSSPVVVQPESGMRYRQDDAANAGKEQLSQAKRDAVQKARASVGAPELIAIDTPTYTKFTQRIDDVASEPRTSTGERRTLTPSPATVEDIFGGGVVGSLVGGLMPQTIMSPSQAQELKQRELESMQKALQYSRDNPTLFPPLNDKAAEAARLRKVAQGFQYEGKAPSDITLLAQKAFTTSLPSGSIVESPLMTAGKILNVSEAAASAAAQATGEKLATIGTDTTKLKGENAPVGFTKNLSSELKSGRGLMGAESEAFSEMGRLAGRSKEEQDTLADIGGLVGLGGGLLLPIDLGVSSAVTTGLKSGLGSMKVAKAIEGTSGLAEGATGALKGSVEGLWDAYRITPRTNGSSTISSQVEKSTKKLLESPQLKAVSDTTLELAAMPQVHAAISADKAAGEAALKNGTAYDPSTLEAELRDAFQNNTSIKGFDSFEEYKQAAESYGIDFTNTAGKRAYDAGRVPTNVISKEAELAKTKTSAGVTTTNHFDDIATGGRSDLYYGAFIDSLDPVVKKELILGKVLKNSDLLPAIDAFMNKIRTTSSADEVAEVATGLTGYLRRHGIDIGDRALGGTSSNGLGKGSFILPKSVEAKEALNKAFRIDTTKKALRNLASDTGIVGTQVKLGNMSMSPSDAKAVLADIKAKVPVLDALRAKLSNGDASVTAEELEALQAYYQKQFKPSLRRSQPVVSGALFDPNTNMILSNRVTEVPPIASVRPISSYSPYSTVRIIDNIAKTGTISAEGFNGLVHSAIAIESAGKATAKTEADLSRISSSLLSKDAKAELSYFTREVFKPKDFSENALGAFLVDNSRRFTNPKNKSVVAQKIVSEVNQRMAALPDRFKASMRAEEAALGRVSTSNRPIAFANTLVKEYTTVPLIITPEQGAYEMFRTNFAAMFGGYEQTIDAMATTGAGLVEVSKSGKITVPEMRDLAATLMEVPAIKTHVDAFTEAVLAGDNVQAINILQRLHADYYGYSIEQILTRKAGILTEDIPAAIASAEARASLREGGSFGVGTSIRKPTRAYEAASSQAMTIAPTNFKELVTGTYFTKAQANIIDHVMDKASVAHPELFPSPAVVDDLARKDFEVVRAGLLRGLETKAQAIVSGSTEQEITAAVKAQRDRIIIEGKQELAKRLREYDSRPPTSEAQALADKKAIQVQVLAETRTKISDIQRPANAGIREINLANKIQADFVEWLKGNQWAIGSADTDIQLLLVAALEDRVAQQSMLRSPKTTYAKKLTDIKKAQEIEAKGLSRLNPADATEISRIDASYVPITREVREVLDTLADQPGSIYAQTYGATLGQEMTDQVYIQGLANIRNQLKSPYSSSLQGVAEKVRNIPALSDASAGIKAPVFNAVNLKRITETMESISLAKQANKLDEVVAANGEKLIAEIEEAEKAYVHALDGLEKDAALEHVAGLKQKAIETSDDKLTTFKKVVSNTLEATWDGLGKLGNIAKSGVLGGNSPLPNVVYIMNNILTAPSIIATQLGLRQGVMSLGTFFDRDLHDIMAAVYLPKANKLGNTTDRVILKAPDGTVYTTSMFQDMVTGGLIGHSQGSAELSNDLIQDAINWAGKTGLYGDTSTARKAITRNFVNPNGMNFWSTFANTCDQYYRLGVLKRALSEGQSLPQASKLARESLFDYGKLSAAEKASISKVFWFWNFQRNSMKSIYVSLLTDPRKLKVAFAQQRGWAYAYDLAEKAMGQKQEDTDYRYIMKDYSESRMFLNLIEDPENQRRYAIYGPPVPALQAIGQLVDYLSIPLGYGAAKAGLSENEPITTPVKQTLALLTENARPEIQFLVAASYGIDTRTGRDLGGYLDPKLMYYINQNSSARNAFDSLIQTEAVPYDQEKLGSGYYQGRQWRIPLDDKDSQKNWAAIKALMLTVGIQRTAQDYAPIAQAIVPLEGYQPDVTMETSALRALGIVTAQDAPLIEEIQKANRAAAAREVKEINVTDIPVSER